MELKELHFLSFIERHSSLKGESASYFQSWFFTENYYRLYLADVKFTDLSFGMIVSPEKWIYVPVTLFNEKLSFLGMPVRVISEGFSQKEIHQIVSHYILQLKDVHNFKTLACFENGLFDSAECQVKEDLFQIAVLDLRGEEEEILKNISKGHKSSIKSGQKVMNLERLDSSNYTEEKFSNYKSFYNKVTGVNKTEEFWEIKKKILADDEGFLILGYVDNELGATSYFLNGDKDVYYGFGIYNRDLMKSGVSLTHWPLYFSIIESKKRGHEKFIIGYLERSETSEKLKAIFDFKKRFSTQTSDQIFNIYTF